MSDQAEIVKYPGPHITLEWDNCKDKVVAARNQVSIAWKDYKECSSSSRFCGNGSKIDSSFPIRNGCTDLKVSGVAEVLTVPPELLELNSLGDILSLETWDKCLSEEEKVGLRRYLPTGVDADVAVSGLLREENLHFGNALTMWSQQVVDGDTHPDRVAGRDQAHREGRKFFFSGLQRYHSGLLETLRGMKAIVDKCKDPDRQLRPQLRRWRNKRLNQLAADAPEKLRPFDEDLERLKRKRERVAQRVAGCGALPEECVPDANGDYVFSDQMYLRARLKKRRVAASKDSVVAFAENGPGGPRRKQVMTGGNGVGTSNGDNHSGDLMRVVKVTKEQMEEILRRKSAGDELRWDALARMLFASGGEREEGGPSSVLDEERVRQHWRTLVFEDLPCAQTLILNEHQSRRQLAKFLAEQCACNRAFVGQARRVQSCKARPTPKQQSATPAVQKSPPELNTQNALCEHPGGLRGASTRGGRHPMNGTDPALHRALLSSPLHSPIPKPTGFVSQCTPAQLPVTHRLERVERVSEVALPTSVQPGKWQERDELAEPLHMRKAPLGATYLRPAGSPHVSQSSPHPVSAGGSPSADARSLYSTPSMYLQKHSLQLAGSLQSQGVPPHSASSGQGHQPALSVASPLPVPFSKGRGTQGKLAGQAGRKTPADMGMMAGRGGGSRKSAARIGEPLQGQQVGSRALDVVGFGLRPLHPGINIVPKEEALSSLPCASLLKEVGPRQGQVKVEAFGSEEMEMPVNGCVSPSRDGHTRVPRGFDIEKSLLEVDQEGLSSPPDGIRQPPQELQLFGPRFGDVTSANNAVSRSPLGNQGVDMSSQYLDQLSSACNIEKSPSTHPLWTSMNGNIDASVQMHSRSLHKGPLQAGSYKLVPDDVCGGSPVGHWHGGERRANAEQPAFFQKGTATASLLEHCGQASRQIGRVPGDKVAASEKMRQAPSSLGPDAKRDVTVAPSGAQQLVTAVLREAAGGLGMRAPDAASRQQQQQQLFQMQQRLIQKHVFAQQQAIAQQKLLAQQQQQGSGWPPQHSSGAVAGDSSAQMRVPMWMPGHMSGGGGSEASRSPASSPMGARSPLWAISEAYQRTGHESDRMVAKSAEMGGAQVASKFLQRNAYASDGSVAQEPWDGLGGDRIHGRDEGHSNGSTGVGSVNRSQVPSSLEKDALIGRSQAAAVGMQSMPHWDTALEIERFRTITSAGHAGRGSSVIPLRQMLSHDRQAPLSRDMGTVGQGCLDSQTSDPVSIKYDQQSFDRSSDPQLQAEQTGAEVSQQPQRKISMVQDARSVGGSGADSWSEREGLMLQGLGIARNCQGEAEEGIECVKEQQRGGNMAAMGLPQWMTASVLPQHQEATADFPAAGQFYSSSSALQAGWMAPRPMRIAPGVPDSGAGQGNWHNSNRCWPPQTGGGSSWA